MSAWVTELRELFIRSEMEVAEFEELLEVAQRGERPNHPDLPAYLPLPMESGER